MKTKRNKRSILNNVLKSFLLLTECIAVFNCCAIINVFSQLNEFQRQRTAGVEIVKSGLTYLDIDEITNNAIEEYEEEHRWKGPVLSKRNGTVIGPSGKETYYNLNMSGVVNIMRRMGNTDEYWVREDGCKMLGDYIMVAANLSLHPRGSLVETSLGTAIVCDTGGFAARNPTQIDVAVTW